jgi:hypothetical protein
MVSEKRRLLFFEKEKYWNEKSINDKSNYTFWNKLFYNKE